jgi:hypothetical protein
LTILFSKPEFAFHAAMFPMLQWIESRLEGKDLRHFSLE